MLSSPCHIIATMRAKQEYVLETNAKGKQEPKKVGMAPVQREGMEYEFTVMLDVDMNHIASASKDRTSLFDGQYMKITPGTGAMLLEWLETGATVSVYDESVLNGYNDVMIECDDLDNLKAAFAVAYNYGKQFRNVDAVTASTSIYNGKKAELTTETEGA